MKVGLKDTLRLMAAGYTKKEIDNLAAIDEENAKDEENENNEKKDPEPVPPAPVITDSKPAPAPEEKKDPEPDYKKMYEDLKKSNDETKATLTKLQQNNVHKDSSAAAADQLKEQNESLKNLVSSFM